MRIDDEIYGPAEVNEPLLLDLLSTRAMQRLGGVSQAGASSLLRRGRTVTRLEHSIGVMLLTRYLGGTTLEQAAGLLQDVSHTAFSHTMDYVFGDREEAFHERIFEEVVASSDLPAVLAKHDLSLKTLFRSENMSLVDVSAPLLCADRIDYTLRDLTRFGHINRESAVEFRDSLRVVGGKIASNSVERAISFVEWYAFLVEHLFMNPVELYAHDEFARLIRSAFASGVLEERDILGTDATVLAKLTCSRELRERLDILKAIRQVSTSEPGNGRRVFSKARVIDPLVLVGGQLHRLSEIVPRTASLWTNILRIGEEGIVVAAPSQDSVGWRAI